MEINAFDKVQEEQIFNGVNKELSSILKQYILQFYFIFLEIEMTKMISIEQINLWTYTWL